MKKIVLLLSLMLLFSACNSTADSVNVGSSENSAKNNIEKQSAVANKTAPLDPCKLMTEQEAEVVLGSGKDVVYDASGDIKPGMGLQGQKICFYNSVKEDELVFAQISTIDPSILKSMSVKELFLQTKAMFGEGGEDYKEVTNIGTLAYRTSGLAGGLKVYDEVSDASFQLTFAGGFGYQPTEQDAARQEELARKIVEKLRSWK